MTEINTNPDIPKTMPDTLMAAVDESGRISLGLLNYIRTGDKDRLREAANGLMRMSTMNTKNLMSRFISCAMCNEDPLTEEERKELYLKIVNEAPEHSTPA